MNQSFQPSFYVETTQCLNAPVTQDLFLNQTDIASSSPSSNNNTITPTNTTSTPAPQQTQLQPQQTIIETSNTTLSGQDPSLVPLYRFTDQQCEEVDRELICAICQYPFVNATRSVTCGHTFCKYCIHQWGEINRTCPIDHTALQVLQSDRLANNLVAKYTVQCLLCNWTGAKSQVESHVKEAHGVTLPSESGTEGYTLTSPTPSNQNQHDRGMQTVLLVERVVNNGPLCYQHSQINACAICASCHKPICANCVAAVNSSDGSIHCSSCLTSRRGVSFCVSLSCMIIAIVVIVIKFALISIH